MIFQFHRDRRSGDHEKLITIALKAVALLLKKRATDDSVGAAGPDHVDLT
jgi:hypothetical protein